MKHGLFVFIVAFLLNFVWENLHSVLYLNYRGGFISEYILARSAVVDAFMVTLIVLVVLHLSFFKQKTLSIVVVGFVVATGLEIWALQSVRWAYAPSMPLIPLLNVGVSPAVQLAITGLVALYLSGLARLKLSTT